MHVPLQLEPFVLKNVFVNQHKQYILIGTLTVSFTSSLTRNNNSQTVRKRPSNSFQRRPLKTSPNAVQALSRT
jgi:hypothetical protein